MEEGPFPCCDVNLNAFNMDDHPTLNKLLVAAIKCDHLSCAETLLSNCNDMDWLAYDTMEILYDMVWLYPHGIVSRIHKPGLLSLLLKFNIIKSNFVSKINDFSILHTATSLSCLKCTNAILAHGADVNVCDNRLQTPLFYTTQSVECAKALLYNGANPNHTNDYGICPLKHAIYYRHHAKAEPKPYIKLLISAGVDYKKTFIDAKSGNEYVFLMKIVEEMGGEEGVYKARQEFEKGRPGSNTKPALKK